MTVMVVGRFGASRKATQSDEEMIRSRSRCALACLWLGCFAGSTVRAQGSSPTAPAEEEARDSRADSMGAPDAGPPQAPNPAPPQTQRSGQGTTSGTGTTAEVMQAEVGDRDITYLRSRAVFRYDYKVQDGPTETNRFRLKLQYAFGPHQRLGLSVNVPVMYKDNQTQSAFGSGDTEVTMGGNFFRTDRFRSGITGQVTFQTSSEQLLGGASTKLKGSWGFTYVFTRRFELTTVLSYKQSIHTARGGPTKQLEPDVTLNTRVLRATWFVESDSYYDFIPDRFAPMIKTGLGRAFGETKSWTASTYIEWPLNGYARQTQEHIEVGLDFTWYPFKKR